MPYLTEDHRTSLVFRVLLLLRGLLLKIHTYLSVAIIDKIPADHQAEETSVLVATYVDIRI